MLTRLQHALRSPRQTSPIYQQPSRTYTSAHNLPPSVRARHDKEQKIGIFTPLPLIMRTADHLVRDASSEINIDLRNQGIEFAKAYALESIKTIPTVAWPAKGSAFISTEDRVFFELVTQCLRHGALSNAFMLCHKIQSRFIKNEAFFMYIKAAAEKGAYDHAYYCIKTYLGRSLYAGIYASIVCIEAAMKNKHKDSAVQFVPLTLLPEKSPKELYTALLSLVRESARVGDFKFARACINDIPPKDGLFELALIALEQDQPDEAAEYFLASGVQASEQAAHPGYIRQKALYLVRNQPINAALDFLHQSLVHGFEPVFDTLKEITFLAGENNRLTLFESALLPFTKILISAAASKYPSLASQSDAKSLALIDAFCNGLAKKGHFEQLLALASITYLKQTNHRSLVHYAYLAATFNNINAFLMLFQWIKQVNASELLNSLFPLHIELSNDIILELLRWGQHDSALQFETEYKIDIKQKGEIIYNYVTENKSLIKL